MEYVKVDDKVAEALGRPRRSIINAIIAGTLKGKRVSPRDTRIEACELPDSFFADGKAPESTGEKAVEVRTDKETSGVTTDLQQTLDDIKLKEAQIKDVEISIKLAEAEKTRDLPDKIKLRDEESLRRDELSKQREDILNQREAILAQQKDDIRAKENDLISQTNGVDKYVNEQNAEANSILTEAHSYEKEKREEVDAYYSSKVSEADAYYHDKVKDADNFDADIQAKREELETLNAQVQEEAEKLINEIKRWIKVADTKATQSYHVAQKVTGRKEEYHIRKSNKLWGIKDKLNKLLKEIGG